MSDEENMKYNLFIYDLGWQLLGIFNSGREASDFKHSWYPKTAKWHVARRLK